MAFVVQCVCRNLKRADVSQFIGTYFKAPRMILAAAGGLNIFLCQCSRIWYQ